MLHIKNLNDGLELFKTLGSDVRMRIVELLSERGEMNMNARTLFTWFGKSLRPVDTTAAPPAFASSGKISGVGFAHAKIIASFAIVCTISLVSVPGADTPMR